MLLGVSLMFLLLGSCLKTHELNISLARKHLVLRFSVRHDLQEQKFCRRFMVVLVGNGARSFCTMAMGLES